MPSLRLPRRALVVAAAALGVGAAEAARFADELEAFAAADRAGRSPAGALLFVGSSTIRLWPDLAARFAPRPVVQRGFGGSTLAEVVQHRTLLFDPHRPDALVVYAGENDVAEGAAPEAVIARWRALRAALAGTPAGAAPVVFIELKPSPARFELWPRMAAVNAAMRVLGTHRPDAFVDTAGFVLDGRGLPRRELFADDSLHFAAPGYVELTHAVSLALKRLDLTR